MAEFKLAQNTIQLIFCKISSQNYNPRGIGSLHEFMLFVPFSVDISNNFTSWVDRNRSQLWVSGYIWGALDITTHSIPGSIPGRQLECWRWLQQLTSLQIFTIYTALEKHVYIAASMLDILHLPQNLSFYLPSPSHKQQQVDRQIVECDSFDCHALIHSVFNLQIGRYFMFSELSSLQP